MNERRESTVENLRWETFLFVNGVVIGGKLIYLYMDVGYLRYGTWHDRCVIGEDDLCQL